MRIEKLLHDFCMLRFRAAHIRALTNQQAVRKFLPLAVFDVVTKLPGTGVGAKVQRNTWPPESYWTVTAVRPTVVRHSSASRHMPPTAPQLLTSWSPYVRTDKSVTLRCELSTCHDLTENRAEQQDKKPALTAALSLQDGNHGKAWGIFTWKGAPKNEQPTRVRGTLKQVWRLFEDPSPKVQWQRLPSTAAKQPASAEVPAAEATVAS